MLATQIGLHPSVGHREHRRSSGLGFEVPALILGLFREGRKSAFVCLECFSVTQRKIVSDSFKAKGGLLGLGATKTAHLRYC